MSGLSTRTFKLTLAYDGAAYVGWQRQQNGPSVQGAIETALEPLAGDASVSLVGAGRTDAGVPVDYLPWCPLEPNGGTNENCLQHYWSGINCPNDPARELPAALLERDQLPQ